MSLSRTEVTFQRDTEVILIPDGYAITVPEGTDAYITQELGGNYTVSLPTGRLVRVDADQADAIGMQFSVSGETPDPTGPVDQARIYEVLRSCYDPEIPVNIVELGLIYGCSLTEAGGGGQTVDVLMTLTAPGCGMGQVLKDDVERKISNLHGVDQVNVELTFDPPWGPERMSDEARLTLGMF